MHTKHVSVDIFWLIDAIFNWFQLIFHLQDLFSKLIYFVGWTSLHSVLKPSIVYTWLLFNHLLIWFILLLTKVSCCFHNFLLTFFTASTSSDWFNLLFDLSELWLIFLIYVLIKGALLARLLHFFNNWQVLFLLHFFDIYYMFILFNFFINLLDFVLLLDDFKFLLL